MAYYENCRLLVMGSWLSIIDGPLMLLVNWTVVDTAHPLSNTFATDVTIKALEVN